MLLFLLVCVLFANASEEYEYDLTEDLFDDDYDFDDLEDFEELEDELEDYDDEFNDDEFDEDEYELQDLYDDDGLFSKLKKKLKKGIGKFKKGIKKVRGFAKKVKGVANKVKGKLGKLKGKLGKVMGPLKKLANGKGILGKVGRAFAMSTPIGAAALTAAKVLG